MKNLDRYKKAQQAIGSGFDAALSEIRAGSKKGHWIWYIFPQLTGLGTTSVSKMYAINSIEEAQAFLRDGLLRHRLQTISEAISEQLNMHVPLIILMGGKIDVKKLVSSLTLFEYIAKDDLPLDKSDDYLKFADTAKHILDTATSQGHPRCSYTVNYLKGV